MMKHTVFKSISFLVCLMASTYCFSAIDVYDFEDEAKRADFIALTKELRCPKCQNQDIADSNAPIAADMRKEVHRLLNEGKDKASIVDYMVERFGEFVTYKPKKTSETYLLWYGPWVLVFIGVIVILTIVKRNKNTDNNASELSTDDVQSLLEKYEEKK